MSADSHAVSPPGTDILVRPHPAGLQLDRVRSMSQSGGVGSPAPKDGAGLPNPEGGGADAARISTDCELDARVSLNHAGALVGTGVACGEARHPPSSQAPTDRTTGPVAASRVGLPDPTRGRRTDAVGQQRHGQPAAILRVRRTWRAELLFRSWRGTPTGCPFATPPGARPAFPRED